MSRFAAVIMLLFFLTPVAVFGQSLDRRMVDKVHLDWQSKAGTRIMEKITLLGDVKVQVGLTLLFSVYGNQKEKETAKLTLSSLALAGATVGALKYAVGRKRPYEKTSRSNSSFPSGHAAAAFTVSSVVASEYPRLKIPAYTLAAAVGFSRVYLGKHYPSDVIVGAVIGYAAGTLVHSKRKAVLSLSF